MAADPVTPTPALTTEVVTAGTAVTVIPAGPNGGTITNPLGAPSVLYVNPVNAATQTANGNTFALQPGQSWDVIPGQTTPTTVNSNANGHTFSAFYY
jgi:hypothetical protein